MTKKEVLSKVTKLFELSKSSNENEAALAAAKARELLSRHNLSMADLPTDELTNALEAAETGVEVGKVLRHWVKLLLVYVARGFECHHVIRRQQGFAPVLTFVGVEADAQVAAYTYQFLFRELNGLADHALPQIKRENPDWKGASLRYAYLEGAVRKIGKRLQEATEEIRVSEQKTCTALVVAKDHLIRDYMKSTYPYMRREYSGRRMVSVDAYEKGYADADTISLNPGIPKDRTDQLLETG